MAVYLVRHGAYDEGNGMLNQRGAEQATTVADYLMHRTAKPAVLSSNGPRARETASLIAKRLGSAHTVVEWLDKVKGVERAVSEIGAAKDGSMVLVMSGELIHDVVASLAESIPLKPLVKGEVILCEITDAGVNVEYF